MRTVYIVYRYIIHTILYKKKNKRLKGEEK